MKFKKDSFTTEDMFHNYHAYEDVFIDKNILTQMRET